MPLIDHHRGEFQQVTRVRNGCPPESAIARSSHARSDSAASRFGTSQATGWNQYRHWLIAPSWRTECPAARRARSSCASTASSFDDAPARPIGRQENSRSHPPHRHRHANRVRFQNFEAVRMISTTKRGSGASRRSNSTARLDCTSRRQPARPSKNRPKKTMTPARYPLSAMSGQDEWETGRDAVLPSGATGSRMRDSIDPGPTVTG